MSPSTAAFLCAAFILGAWWLNRDSETKVSPALWLPALWLFICASRPVTMWLPGSGSTETAENAFQEGSPIDAQVFAGFLVAGLIVLFLRRDRVKLFLKNNTALLLFFSYCFISIAWSDFQFVSFKRWTKELSDLVMVLVVLTDPDPAAALKRLFTRCGFVLVPLSILLIRYFPDMGRGYNPLTGEAFNYGVATGKNGLGYVCLISGLGIVWCLIEHFRTPGRRIFSGPLVALGTMLLLTFWLFQMTGSATSLACFMIGSALILAGNMRWLTSRPVLVGLMIASVLFIVLYATILNPGGGLVELVGRDSTLTGRTAIWNIALSVSSAPILGAGYESFWLGERLQKIWAYGWQEPPNQAHSGYLEIYLDLGWVGVTLLALVIIAGFMNVVRAVRLDPEVGKLRVALFTVALVYNLTEHAFRELHPVWLIFLLAVIVTPDPTPEVEDEEQEMEMFADPTMHLQENG